MLSQRFSIACLAAASVLSAITAHGETTFLGPTPYLSRADSPFPVDGSNPNFYLEDFEDGQLNTPGISQKSLFPQFGHDYGIGTVMGPGVATASVDADDGAIDGLGRAGHSLRTNIDLITPTFPPGHGFEIIFEFDEQKLGLLPNSFGFVWTDGMAGSNIALQVFTQNGASITGPGGTVGDGSRDGTTSEARFFGVVTDDGIARVIIHSGYLGGDNGGDYIQVDHVQYGLPVPEPSTLSLMTICAGVLLARQWIPKYLT